MGANKIWIVQYTHRHGTDVWTRTSEDSAYRSACDTALDYLDEVETLDEQREILAAIIAKDYSKALDLYGESAQESFEIFESEVLDTNPERLHERACTCLAGVEQEISENDED